MCNSKMNYSGFKHGFRCTVKCGIERRTKKIILAPLSKELILQNITKSNYVSRKFLRLYQITEKECYNIVYKVKYCIYCNNESIFKNWITGYKNRCSSKTCSKIQRAERTRKTNLQSYGTKNVSDSKIIKRKKKETFKKNYGVDNISQLQWVQDKIRKTMELSGRWIKEHERNDKNLYEIKVRKQSAKQPIHTLSNYKLRGPVEKNGWHLDHIYSVSEGFKNNIPIHIIANINNLRMIPARENQSKNSRSDISLQNLLDKMS